MYEKIMQENAMKAQQTNTLYAAPQAMKEQTP